ncbi:MAG: YicC family protein [Candidatus Omnitrophica bacterium]|nr:YicC family protein [Candidatus Omnitrophota bacterium]
MIKSMTGFGKGESVGRFGRFIVEIRTVNHRYFDVSNRIPNSLNQAEDKIKKYIHRYIRRGKVNFSISHRRGEKELGAIKFNEETIDKYYKLLNRIKKKFKLKDEIKLSNILSFPDVMVQEQTEYEASSLWPAVERALKKAILDCNRMKEKEGKALYKDLASRIDKISGSIDNISQFGPVIISEYKARLDSKIEEVLKGREYNIDKARLETELAIFAKQCDVTEEITRSRSHLEALRHTIISNQEAGRRLDFILQELQREINTLGAKAGNVKVAKIVLDIKSEIEKMREQAQNVE